TAPSRSQKVHKFHATPCLVSEDGTLFTATEIELAEAARHVGVQGTLQERAAHLGIVGRWFASTKEGKRYLELRALERVGAITQLRCQVVYDLSVTSDVDGQRHVVGRLIVDFSYQRDGVNVIEDVKGAKTLPIARLKIKMLEAQYGIKLHEIRDDKR